MRRCFACIISTFSVIIIMAKSLTTFEKPLPHISLSEWYKRNVELQENALTKRSDAFEVRNAGQNLRSDTKIKSEWGTYTNNSKLANKVTELKRWGRTFEDLLNKVVEEIKVLKDEKFDAERELEALNHPLRIAGECISIRDTRRGTELTVDEADTELKKELCIIDNIKNLLTKRVHAAWEKLKRLEEMKFKIDLELEDKNGTIRIDSNNTELTRDSAGICYRPNVLQNKKSISYESWLEHSSGLKSLGDIELSDSHYFREAMHVMRERARNDIKAQQDYTDYTLRKRIYETQKAKNELEWQQLKTTQEMDKLLNEINNLELALLHKANSIKCAETRLINRTFRSGSELCQDDVELGLKSEIVQLKQMEEDLQSAFAAAKAAYNNFECLQNRLNINIDNKQHALTTDVMCLDLRSTLILQDKTRLPNETNRNIVLTRMEQEIPIE
ncbi:tektin-B1 isoform X2 [Prorops nasuta]|uniref:tektin-B1 isoform X2 n=2 Tax=Prorops nasuta TaxID=863751 RepID=UPI0034CF2141